MATFFSNEYVDYWSRVSNRVYGTLTGDVRRDGNTVYLENMSIELTPTETSWGTSPWSFTVSGTTTSTTINAPPTTVALNSTSFSVSPSQTSASVSWSAPENSGSFTVNFPSGATSPSGGYISSVVPGIDSITLTGGVTSMGTGGTQTYAELIILNAPFTQAGIPQRYEGFNALSATKTISNSSPVSAGGITISPNTKYYKGVYAYNGVADAYRYNGGEVYTLPPELTSASDGTQTYLTYNTVNVPVTVNYPADGGALTKSIIYRANKGSGWSDWQTITTVSGSSSGTTQGNITLDTSSSYTVEFKSRTTAGDSPNAVSLSIDTLSTHTSPTIGTWTFVDSNSEVTGITGSNTVLIQNVSIPRVRIDKDQITTYDSIALSSVSADVNGLVPLTEELTYYTRDFPSPTSSGTLTGVLKVKDALQAEGVDTKTLDVLAYTAPTLNMTVTIIGEDGESQLSVAGTYSPLEVSGVEKNTLTCSYRLSDTNGVVVDWTTIALDASDGEYGGVVSSIPTDFDNTYMLEVKLEDVFNEVDKSETISSYNRGQELHNAQYDIEVWTRDGNFVADISKYLTSDLDITWTLNDIEELSFTVSFDAVEILKNTNQLVNFLTPYAQDIRIRRNGDYIVGCQIVESSVKIQNEGVPSIQVKATGFLNIFKDQYISEPMAGYTYPEMAHKLINRAQHSDCLIKNPTGDIDASYWLSPVSAIAQTSICVSGLGAIQAISSSGYWTSLGSPMTVKAGTPIHLDFWLSGSTATFYVRERNLINNSSTQGTILTAAPTTANTYEHFTADYTTQFDNGYIYIEQQQVGTPLRIDNVFVSRTDDEDSLNNHYVGCIYVGLDDTTGGTGHNYADTGYSSTREYNYELQNVKDAIMDLVSMEDDKFDFEFTPDRIFNTYERKGTDRLDIEVSYPGNAYSITADVSAADMGNKVQMIGSGIGDERLEIVASDANSRSVYGTRESIVTENNVSLEDTLKSMAYGELEKRGKMTRNLQVTIQDGSINGGNIQTGDSLIFKTEDYLGVLPQQMGGILNPLKDWEAWYRVKKKRVRVSQDGVESVELVLEYEEDLPEPEVLGSVTYYTDNTYTTTNSVVFASKNEIMELGRNSSAAKTVTINNVSVNMDLIKEVNLGSRVYSIPNNFLAYCNYVDVLGISNSRLTRIPKGFFRGAGASSVPEISLPDTISNIGDQFLQNRWSFNSPLSIPENVTDIGSNFMDWCTGFNSPLIIGNNVQNIGKSFLYGASIFNQPLSLNGVSSLGNNFLSDCHAFNQPIAITSENYTIGPNFMSNCIAFNQPLDLSKCVSIGYSFLVRATAFNGSLTLPANDCNLGYSFLSHCYMFNQPLNLPNEMTTIPNHFMYYCNSFNEPLNLPANITQIGLNFLAYTTLFDQPLALNNVQSIGNNFLASATRYNQLTNLPSVENIDEYFLYNAKNLNAPVNIANAQKIGAHFMQDTNNFNQVFNIPQNVSSIGNFFMYNANKMTNVINVGSVPASVFTNDNRCLATYGNGSLITTYTTGKTIKGAERASWLTAFPNSDARPFRKLLDGGE